MLTQSPYPSTTIDLLRHGEPVGGRKYRGQLDDPLSEKGWSQMRAAVAGHCPWTAVVSSPLRRCSEFARELAAQHGLQLHIDARFMEIGFGTWQGLTAAEIGARDPLAIQRFLAQPLDFRPPGAEALVAFRDRVVAAFNDLLGAHAGAQVLVVGHAGVIRMVMRHVLDMPLEALYRIQVPNAGITRIQIDTNATGTLPRLVFHAGCL